jgi:hypothetical protein
MGDIAPLAANIHDIGLLHPIVIKPDGTLIAGQLRLRAAQLLGWAEIPVTVMDLDAVVHGEYAENTFPPWSAYPTGCSIMFSNSFAMEFWSATFPAGFRFRKMWRGGGLRIWPANQRSE